MNDPTANDTEYIQVDPTNYTSRHSMRSRFSVNGCYGLKKLDKEQGPLIIMFESKSSQVYLNFLLPGPNDMYKVYELLFTSPNNENSNIIFHRK